MVSLFLFITAALAATVKVDFGVTKVKESVSRGSLFVPNGVPAPTTKLQLKIGLKQKNIQGLQKVLHDISDPESPNYGKWLTKEETYQYISPEPATVTTVKQWLAANGVDSIKQNSPGWLTVDLPVTQIETLLATKFSLITHPGLTLPVPRVSSYSLPASLHDLIDTIQPTTEILLPTGWNRAQSVSQEPPDLWLSKRAGSVQCNPNNIVPACVQAYYTSNNYKNDNRGGAQVGTVSLGSSANHSDATLFYTTYTPNTVPGNQFIDITSSAETNNGATNTEGNLDTEWSGGMSNGGQPYYINQPSFAGFADFISNPNQHAPPSVSVSYTTGELDNDQSYLQRLCNEFMTAGSLGYSIFAASGDAGAGPEGGNCHRFAPQFPPTCPYVTAVGGTQFGSSASFTVGNSDPGETVAQYPNNGSSGGGFSTVFSNGAWAAADVKKYVSGLGSLDSSRYNHTGRGYPDIAALSNLMVLTQYNGFYLDYGTSFSAPIWAGLVSLINDYQLSRGRSTLGFISPLLYKYHNQSGIREGLVDIVKGVGGIGGSCGAQTGFPAKAGWDAVTGLGTPRVDHILALLN